MQVAQAVISGLTLGAIYALVALGFVTVYNVTRVINFAQGDFVMLGAMLTAVLVPHLPLYLAVPVAVAAAFVAGAVMHRVALHPAWRAGELVLIIITIGVSIAIRGAALLIWGTFPAPVPPFSGGGDLHLLGLVITRQALWVWGVAALALVALKLFFDHTTFGQGLRAAAANPMAARLMGIRPARMATLAFALAAATAGLAGAVVAPITFASYDMGLGLGLKGFVAAIVGGLTNPAGAVVGGLLLGVLEALAASVRSSLTDVVAFAVLLAVLLLTRVRPLGASERDEAGGA
jgi:branched-chain amino acid transport system permease protein